MPSIARLNDIITIHGCGQVPHINEGSENVFINNKPVHRVGDANTSHAQPLPLCPQHITVLSEGSPNIFVNNKKVGRVGDTYSCPISIKTGSQNVFGND